MKRAPSALARNCPPISSIPWGFGGGGAVGFTQTVSERRHCRLSLFRLGEGEVLACKEKHSTKQRRRDGNTPLNKGGREGGKEGGPLHKQRPCQCQEQQNGHASPWQSISDTTQLQPTLLREKTLSPTGTLKPRAPLVGCASEHPRPPFQCELMAESTTWIRSRRPRSSCFGAEPPIPVLPSVACASTRRPSPKHASPSRSCSAETRTLEVRSAKRSRSRKLEPFAPGLWDATTRNGKVETKTASRVPKRLQLTSHDPVPSRTWQC